jgi:hypothetical protein
MEMIKLGLKFGVLDTEASSNQKCPLTEVPLYLKLAVSWTKCDAKKTCNDPN